MRPTDIPVLGQPDRQHPSDSSPPDIIATTVAMASRITIQVPDRFGDGADSAAQRAAARQQLDRTLGLFHAVDRSCTRFRSDSDLMRANASPRAWVNVDELCFDALREAYDAYRSTGGRFDPRVLDDLVRLGYARSFTLGAPDIGNADEAHRTRGPLPAWRPELRDVDRCVRLATDPDDTASVAVDLGGIGKGLAVRWATAQLRSHGLNDHLVEAGGDCYGSGRPADGESWRVGVEDPLGGADPVAVLEVSNAAVTTSSVRLRQWRVGDQQVHHIIDPRTGRPGGDGLLSVSVVHGDAATAEVWGKVLFLQGADGIADEAARLNLPALWVDEDGGVGASPAIRPHLLWRRS